MTEAERLMPRNQIVEDYIDSVRNIIIEFGGYQTEWEENGKPEDHIGQDIRRMRDLFEALLLCPQMRELPPSKGGLSHYFQFVEKKGVA